jgi:predicted nuclease of restriction endonuclease-like (RecB) superfamily
MKKTDLTPTPADAVTPEVPVGYAELLQDIKARVRAAQIKAALAVNRELVLLYWSIGRDILARQQEQGWGAKVIDRLSADLRRELPEMQGFSPRNLKYMRAFAEAWPDEGIVQAPLAQITWYHNIALMEKLASPEERPWYAQQTIEYGWSRNVLVNQIESRLYQRQGKAVTNFERTLPAPQSDLARQLLKDPYNFDFLTLASDAEERKLEARGCSNIFANSCWNSERVLPFSAVNTISSSMTKTTSSISFSIMSNYVVMSSSN